MINSEEKISFWETVRNIDYKAMLLCMLSFLMGRVCMFDGFYCVGIAYVGVLFFNKEIRMWAGIFTILGLLTVGTIDMSSVKYILTIILLLGFRMAMGFFRCEYNYRNQVVITSISLCILSFITELLLGITPYKIIIMLLEIVSTIGMMYILNIAIQIIYKNEHDVQEYEVASIAFFIACIICGCIDFYIALPYFGKVYFRDTLIFVVLLTSIYWKGMSAGMIVGTIVSSILVIIGYMPASFISIYIVATLMAGLFSQLERVGIIFAMCLGILLGFALFNNRVIDFTIMGSYVFGALIFLLIPRRLLNIYGNVLTNQEAVDYHMHDIEEILAGKLRNFSVAFNKLGRQFERLPARHYNLEVPQMNILIDETAESMCKNCTMQNFCWKDYSEDTYKSCYKMIRTLDKQGNIKEGDIPSTFKKACIYSESFAYTLGMMLDLYKNDCKWQENFAQSRKMIASQLIGVGQSIEQLSVNIEEDLSFDYTLEGKIKEELLIMGIYIKDIMVLNMANNNKEIHLYCVYKGEKNLKERIQVKLEKILEKRLEIKKYQFNLDEKYSYFVFVPQKVFNISSSVQYLAKEEVSGDGYSYLELEDGQYLMALADGMGSGKYAKEESQMTIELLEKFLEAGFTSEVAIQLINSALVLKSDIECSTSVDMVLIDQYTGMAKFLKAGASKTFILREDQVITLSASSLPIGILNEVDLMCYEKQLNDGDMLIMVTDGILEDQNELAGREATFKHFIKEADTKSPDYMARFLMDKTRNLLAGSLTDDMTVLVARVWHEQEV